MTYAIELFFDNKSEERIIEYYLKFKELNISTYLLNFKKPSPYHNRVFCQY